MNVVLIYFLCLRVQYLPAVCHCIWALETCVDILAFCVKLRLCFSMESKKWWHTKTLMSANYWCSPRRASTCCSSTSSGITRWSSEPHSSITERENCSGMRSTMSTRHVASLVPGDQGRERPYRSYERLHICCFFCSVLMGNLHFQTSFFLP